MLLLPPLLYLALVMGIGLSHRRTAEADTGAPEREADFFLARRSGGLLLLTGSLLATMFGSFGVMGMSGLGYGSGLASVWYLWVGALGLVLLAAWALGRVELGDAYTLPELLGRAYGAPVRVASALLISVAWLSIIAAQLIAAGKILDFLGAASGAWSAEAGLLPLLIAGVTVVFVAYTCLGGQHSVLRTDLLQAVVIFVGLVALVWAAWGRVPGWRAAAAPMLLEFPFSESMTPWRTLTLLLVFGVPYLVGPDIYSRLFSGRDQATGRRAVLAAAAAMVPLVFLIVLAGVLGSVVLEGQKLPSSDVVLLHLGREVLHPVWLGLLLAALLAAIMSSADTCLLTVATLLTRDVGRVLATGRAAAANPIVQGRVIIALTGALALGVALLNPSIVGALYNSYKIYSPAVLAPFLAIVVLPRFSWGWEAGAASVLLGGGTALVGVLLGSESVQIAAFPASALPLLSVWLIGRLVGAPPARS